MYARLGTKVQQAAQTLRLPFGTNHSEEGLAGSVMRHVLMEPTMRWIVFVLWFLLTPIWIGYSSSAGSGPRVAFIPPALALIALVFTWLWKRLVVRIAGEFEPLYFHPHWGSAVPLRGTLRIALVAVAVGVCAGAVVGQSIFDTAVFNRSATRPANQANLPISVQTETAKSQSFSAEPKAVSTIIVRTEPVKSPVQPTSSDQAQDLTELNELKAKIWEAEVAQRNFAAGLPHCSELNGTNFYFSQQNRVLNLQDYRRSLDNLVTQGVFPWNRQDADARWAQVQKQATTDQANCMAVASLPSLRQKLKELQQRQ
jgi:hypothetical protein